MSDPLKVIEDLPSTENYLPEDRYHDFRKVFSTTEGQRVFRELLSWGRMFQPSVQASPIDPYLMARRDGERNIALKLLATYSNEPVIRSDKQKRTA